MEMRPVQTVELMLTVNPMTFAKRLKDSRLAAGMTQRQLADKCGISDRTVSAWETGLAEGILESYSRRMHRPGSEAMKDPILARAQQVAEDELSPYLVLPLTRDNVLAIARAAYLQGRVDVRLDVVRGLRGLQELHEFAQVSA